MCTRKVALVTGSNKGIGFAIVRQLCQRFDGDVVLCSRDESRGKAAVAQLESEGLKPKLIRLAIDDKKSVMEVKDWLVKEYGGLDVLVNNAAINYEDESVKPRIQIAEETLSVNYFGTADVSEVLFPILRPGARVVNVSSLAGMLMEIPSPELRLRIASPSLTRQDIDSLAYEFMSDITSGTDKEKGWPTVPYSAYTVSKVLICALTWLQDRQFRSDKRQDLIVNAVNPGYVKTDMTEHKGPLSIEEGAFAPVHCALVPSNGEPRGQMLWYEGSVVDWRSDVIGVTDVPMKKDISPGVATQLPDSSF